jgi:glycosyltransferase involved in cell wall biosynthesis
MNFVHRPLRIIHSEAATSYGWQEHRVFKEMIAMRERGHIMEAICQPGSMLRRKLEHEGFRVHSIEMDGVANYFKGLYKVAGILHAARADILNTHSRRDTVIAAAAGRLVHTPLIVRTRHLAKPPGSLWTYTGLPHKVIGVSEYVRGQLLDRGVAAEDVETVYTAVPKMHRLARSTLRIELGIAESAVVVVCVGHLRAQKGQSQLIDAMAQVMSTRRHVHLVFVGTGAQLETLQTHAFELGVRDRTHFLGRRDDIANVLSGANIFALTTQFEALGTAFIEAQSCGLPIVGTRVGGVPEAVVEGVTALLVPFGDDPALVRALVRLVDDPGLCRTMGDAGARMVEQSLRFAIPRMAQNMEHAYLQWLATESVVQAGPAF